VIKISKTGIDVHLEIYPKSVEEINSTMTLTMRLNSIAIFTLNLPLNNSSRRLSLLKEIS
jgi:hypothetical protein